MNKYSYVREKLAMANSRGRAVAIALSGSARRRFR